jgi:hypothetical protein
MRPGKIRLEEVGDRLADPPRIARAYATFGLAIAFTNGLEGEAARLVSGPFHRATPLTDAGSALRYMQRRCPRANPVVVLGPSRLNGLDFDGEEGQQCVAELGIDLPATVTVQKGCGLHFWYRAPLARRRAPWEIALATLPTGAYQTLLDAGTVWRHPEQLA